MAQDSSWRTLAAAHFLAPKSFNLKRGAAIPEGLYGLRRIAVHLLASGMDKDTASPLTDVALSPYARAPALDAPARPISIERSCGFSRHDTALAVLIVEAQPDRIRVMMLARMPDQIDAILDDIEEEMLGDQDWLA